MKMDVTRVLSLLWQLQVWMSEDAFGGPKLLKLSWLVNLHKGGVFPVVLLLMAIYGHSSPSAWVYAGLHGSYGLCWLMKAATFPDLAFERPATLFSGLVFVPALLSLYYVFAWLIASGRGGDVSLPVLCFCIALHNVGLLIMMVSDCQKFVALQAKGRHLITDGMFARIRHPNYLGEIMLYSAYGIIANHWLAWAVLMIFWSLLFTTRIAHKEASMSRYQEWVKYVHATGVLLPRVGASRCSSERPAGALDSAKQPLEPQSQSAKQSDVNGEAEGEREEPLGPKAGVKHMAVIMDGNRRFGKRELGDRLRGHQAGGEALGRFIDACMEQKLEMLTVYAFSTENWNRSEQEVETLMEILCSHAEEMRTKALAKGIRIRMFSTQPERLPAHVRETLQRLEADTCHPAEKEMEENEEEEKETKGEKKKKKEEGKAAPSFQVNICVSYGARDEITKAARRIAEGVAKQDFKPDDVSEELMSSFLTTKGLPDPEVLVRTSGEMRLSNFLLFQCAYSELIFTDKLWPEICQEDLKQILREYMRRQRRFGK